MDRTRWKQDEIKFPALKVINLSTIMRRLVRLVVEKYMSRYRRILHSPNTGRLNTIVKKMSVGILASVVDSIKAALDYIGRDTNSRYDVPERSPVSPVSLVYRDAF